MVPQMLGIDFGWYSFYRGNFAPIALNERCSICSFFHCIWCIESKFSMDFPENLVNIQLLIPFKQACWKYHDQNIENFHVKALNGRRLSLKNLVEICYFFDFIEICNFTEIWWFYNTSTANGRRLSLENWLKSVISLISLKSGDLIKIDNFSCKYTRRYEALFWKLLKICYFFEICSSWWNH